MNFRTPPKPVKLVKKKQEQEEPPKPVNIKVEIFKTLQSLPLESFDLTMEDTIQVTTLNEGEAITLTENSAIILKNSKSHTVSLKDKKGKYKEWFESKVAELSEDRKLLGQKICRDMLKEIASIALTPVKSENPPEEEDDEDDTASALAAARASKTKVVEVEEEDDDSEISEDVTENSESPFDVSENSSTENWDDDIEED